MATHDLARPGSLADEVVLLHRGRVWEHSTAGRFFSTPVTLEAAALLRDDLLW